MRNLTPRRDLTTGRTPERFLLALAFLCLCAVSAQAARPAPDPDDGAIKLPSGFRALVVADDLGPLRFVAVAPGGDLHVKTREAGIIALRDTNGDGRADRKETFGSGGGTGIALRDGWLYHSSNATVFRYKLAPGELVPKGEPETIVSDLPAERQHNSKSFAFDPNEMPGFPTLTDGELAELLTYVRREFGREATPITSSQVAAVRKRRTAGR